MNYPTHPSAPPPSMQPWEQQQQQQQQPVSQPPPPSQQMQWQAAPMSMSIPAKAPSRNIGMIIGGAVLLLVALGAGIVFAINLHQYLTIDDRWNSDPMLAHNGSQWVVELIKRAALKRMMIFGAVSGAFGLGGLVLGGLGLRKK